MAKIRVHELAKELGIASKEMVEVLQGLGLDIKNHMSTMEDSQAKWVRKRLGKIEDVEEPVQPKTGNKVKIESPVPVHKDRPIQPKPERSAEVGSDQPMQGSRPAQTDAHRPNPSYGSSRQQPQPTDRRQDGPGPGVQAQDRPRTGMQPQPDRPRPGFQSQDRPRTGTQPQPDRPRPGFQPQDRPGTGTQPQPDRPGTGTQPSVNRQNSLRPGGYQPQENRRPPNQAANAVPGNNTNSLGSATTGDKKPFTNKKSPPNKTVGKYDKNAKVVNKTSQQTVKDYGRPHKKTKHKYKKDETVLQVPQEISIEGSITVRDLADKLHRSPAELMKKLMELGIMASINQMIDYETAEIVASLYETKVQRQLSQEEKMLEEIVDDEDSLKTRPPVVTIMGHVDHGKTSLLDKIRKSDVVSGEAGGITQHIGAYQATINSNRITFVDTPGHEAFTAMRARGANITDIVVLVVAADDGVMPQTVEAINHIKAANVPFLVAVNKIDKPDANADKVMQQLTEYAIVPEDWGGETIFAQVSAKTGEGIENLLEMILLVAEVHEITANPDRTAEGVVIEAQLDKGRGAVATVLVQKGTLNVGDFLLSGTSWCKVRAMTDYRGRRVDKADPSMPVELTGWSEVPEAGGRVQVCDEKVAKEITNLRVSEKKLEEQGQSSRVSLDDFFKQMKESNIKDLNLIIKGDVQGSIEALVQSLLRLSTDEVKVNVIHSAVGAVTETDVMLASASSAIIIGFNVRPDTKARKYAEDEKIDVRLYRVIYEAIEDVKKAMVGLLDPEYREKYLGRAEVRATFKVPAVGTVAGSYVNDGKLQRTANVRVLRDGVIIYEGKLASLKRFKDDAKEVVANFECGIAVKDFNDVKEGDIIEAYTMEEVPRQL